jgi:hypothetical protein
MQGRSVEIAINSKRIWKAVQKQEFRSNKRQTIHWHCLCMVAARGQSADMRLEIPGATLLAALATANAASIVYDGGAPSFQNAYGIAGIPPATQGPTGSTLCCGGVYYQAESFTLSGTETITNGVFWVPENAVNFPTAPAPPPGLEWIIFSDASGLPGAVVATGDSSEASTSLGSG